MINIPLTPMDIKNEILNQVKKGSVILNFSREGIVDLQAVKQAISDGVLAKYVTDFHFKPDLGRKFMSQDDPFRRYYDERKLRDDFEAKLGDAAADAKGDYFDPNFYEKLKLESKKWQDVLRDYSNAAVLVPVGLWSFSEAYSFPDMDISILGIGNHRFFLFHSGAAAWVIKRIYCRT